MLADSLTTCTLAVVGDACRWSSGPAIALWWLTLPIIFGVGFLAQAVSAGSSLVSSLTSPKSPRFGGGDGPLFSTVNSFLTRVASGEVGVIDQLNTLRQTDTDKVQWQLLWATFVPLQPITAAQRARIVQLDGTMDGKLPPPSGPGTAVLASPNEQPPSSFQQYVVNPVREGLSEAAANLGAGVGAAAAKGLAPKDSARSQTVLLPFTPRQAVYLAGAVVLVLVGVAFASRRGRR